MAELQTYVFPAIQAFFLLIIAIAWLVGFIRQRNLGFLLLTIVFLAEGVAIGIRQAIINHGFTISLAFPYPNGRAMSV